MIPGISGLPSGGSSRSADLQSSLESRLQASLEGLGSPEYALTWKHWDMESGPPICALRGSVRRISGKGCGGWPTPTSRDHKDGTKKSCQNVPVNSLLGRSVHLAGWPTPTSSMMTWQDLNQALTAGNGSQRKKYGDSVTLLNGHGSSAVTERKDEYRLNPRFSLWLMGYPAEWASCGEQAMQSFRSSRRSSSKQLGSEMIFRTVVADPPWNERGGGRIKRGADRHFSLLKTPDIIALMQTWMGQHEITENSHFYLWVTNNRLRDGMKILDALGYRYITNIVWPKSRMGIGQYFRGQHELCLFAVRGKGFAVRTERRDISTVITGDVREHSRKPDSFSEMVENRSVGPYLYMFSRQSRPGWTMLGDEKEKFDP